jgi:hypothetical protein
MDDFEKACIAHRSLCESTGQSYERPSRMHSETKAGVIYLKSPTGSILGCYNISIGKMVD